MSSSSSTWLGLVDKHSHEATGFWGPPNSNHVFCEPHYAVSPFITEFYNALSSMIFTAVAVYSLHREPKIRKDPFIFTIFLCLVIIGFGSFAFHATMRHEMQLADEIPMVCFMGCLSAAKLSKPKAHPWVPNQTVAICWSMFVATMCLIVIWTYVVLDEYDIFIYGFTVIVLFDLLISLPFADKKIGTEVHTRCGYMSLFLIASGRIVWGAENRFCNEYKWVYPLHILWHFLGCGSAYWSALFTCAVRFDKDEVKTLDLLGLPRTYVVKKMD